MFDAVDRTTEEGLLDELDPETMARHLDAFEGLHRYPGTDDQWEAAEYIVETLEEYGAEADLRTVEAYTSVPVDAALEVSSPRRFTVEEAITTAFSANTPPDGVTADLAYLESVGADPDAIAHVEGRHVLTPGLPTPAKVATLDAAGAAGLICISPTEGELHEMIVSPVWGTPDRERADDLPDLPVAEIHQSDGNRLRELVAGDAVAVTVRTETTTGLTDLPCPVGRIEGTESERYAVVGNHIDSWHEGITDNATAMAVSLELARVFGVDPPKRGLLFGFWPGHSMGRYAGSAGFADAEYLDLRRNGIAYLHLDLNGLRGADRLWFQHMAELEAETRDVLEHGSLPLADGSGDGDLIGTSTRPGRNSDQSFWGAGLSSVLFGGRFSGDHPDAGPIGGGWWWHTPADTRDKVDLDLMTEEAELYVRFLSRLCNSPVVPRDYRATCVDIREALGETGIGSTDVDAEPIHTRLDRLEDRLDEFAETVARSEPRGVDQDIEDLQVQLGNLLIPALYTTVAPTEHEAAMPRELLPSLRVAAELPSLSGPKRRFAELEAQRGVSRVAAALEDATDAVESFLYAR